MNSLVLNPELIGERLKSPCGLNGTFDRFHAGNLQPIVAIGQQLILAAEVFKLQPVVVITKEQAKAAFSRRLNQVLDEDANVPKERGRRSWVAKRFSVSIETARKWLTGLDLPDEGNFARIVADLHVSAEWLRSGQGDRRPQESDPVMDELQAVMRSLPTEDREEVLRYAKFRQGNPTPPRPPDSPTIHPRPRHPRPNQ